MACAAWPCRQGTVSCSPGVVEPKYPGVMLALGEGNSLPGPQRSPCAGSPKQWQPSRRAGSRYDGRGVDHGSPTALWRATGLHARLAQ